MEAKESEPIPNGPNDDKPKPPRRKGPNLAQLHANPLPLATHPLPAFHPSNPISLLRLVFSWLSDIFLPGTSHPTQPYIGYFSPETRSVHVTDPRCARVLWQMGFFGKGSLSRSELNWLKREEARVREEGADGGRKAAEDATHARREERRLFKLERARVEREAIERQRLVEEGKLDVDVDREVGTDDGVAVDGVTIDAADGGHDDDLVEFNAAPAPDDDKPLLNDSVEDVANEIRNGWANHLLIPRPQQLPAPQVRPADEPDAPPQDDDRTSRASIQNQEHLQLTFEESFFLCYALGVLSIYPVKRRDPSPLSTKSTPQPYSPPDLVELFCQFSSFPPADTPWITPDDQFLLNYVAYHHFRSLGWVVRPGQKFAVDYLLYNRGPVFSHAEFAVIIIPAYTDRYWNTPGGRARRRVYEQKDWWWLHCANRVQSQVKKTLVLCYIDIPSELDLDFDDVIDVGKLLRSYKVREFVVRRWLVNRSRD